MAILNYKDKSEVPEDLKDFIEDNKDGDGFVVVVGPKKTINEFRENNQKLQDEKNEVEKKLKSLDSILGDNPEEFKEKLAELKETAQKVEDGKLKGSDEVEKEVARRVDAIKVANDAKMVEKEAELGVLRNKVEDQSQHIRHTELADYIRQEAAREDIGVNDSAMTYIIADATTQFEKDESGKFVRKIDGKLQLGEDGYSPQTGNEWLKSLKTEKSFFFKDSSGGGADGDTSGKYGGLNRDAFMKLSPQQKLEMANKAG